MAKYNPLLGVMGNIEKLFKDVTRANNNISSQRQDLEMEILDLSAEIIESVEDEFNATYMSEEEV